MLVIGAWLTLGCTGLPTTSRSGAVHDILITEDRISPEDLTVKVGDEVRWVNHRLGPVWIYFMRDSLDEISCSRGFSLFWGTEESAKIEPGQSVSVCFGREDLVSYAVQREETVIRGSSAGEGGSFSIPKGMNAAIIIQAAPSRRPH